MLPDDVYASYYDRPCGICCDTISINRGDEVGNCKICGKDMCEECMFHWKCDVCKKKMEGDDDSWDCPDDVCKKCLEKCTICEVKFHTGKCKVEHKKTCNARGRAKRAYGAAKTAVKDQEQKIERTKRTLAAMETELKAAKRTKTAARLNLEHIHS